MDINFFKKKFTAVGIGSFPVINPQEACQFIKEVFKDDVIFWPQLVKRSFLENMYVQYSQGLPSVKIDKDKQRVYIDTANADYPKELEATLEHYLEDDVDYFSIGADYAQGLHTILNDQSLSGVEYLKGQIVGPISFGLTLRQENDRSIIYNKELYQAVVKALSMKARWQIRKLKSANPKRKVIIFIDEPYLVSVGSSFVSLKKEEVSSDLNEVIDAIHQEDALAGVHCCGNTDWSILLNTNIDILNFDAYNYLDNLLIFQEELKAFLNKGKILAWGIVPTTEEVNKKSIRDDLLNKIKQITKEKRLFENQVLISPSCGSGTLSVELAKKIHLLTVELTAALNNEKIS